MSEQAFTSAARAAKSAGINKQRASELLEEAYGVRRVNGFEVVEGWEMPVPPRAGMTPCVQFHGGDGLALFWWDSAWGEFPTCFQAWRKMREEGLEDTLQDADPLIEPDTGGHNYKACAGAYAELGFDL